MALPGRALFISITVVILLAVWLTAAFFNSSEFYRRAIGSGA